MVATTRSDPRIQIGLESIELSLHDLHEIDPEWPRLTDAERASWSHDWDQMMGTYLPLLDRHYRSGRLASQQEARYLTLLDNLAEALPIIDRLNLRHPPAPLERSRTPRLRR